MTVLGTVSSICLRILYGKLFLWPFGVQNTYLLALVSKSIDNQSWNFGLYGRTYASILSKITCTEIKIVIQELPRTTTDAVSENVSETVDKNIAKEVIQEPEPEKENIPDIGEETPVLPVHDASIDTNKESIEPVVTVVEDTSTSKGGEAKITEAEMDVKNTKTETDKAN